MKHEKSWPVVHRGVVLLCCDCEHIVDCSKCICCCKYLLAAAAVRTPLCTQSPQQSVTVIIAPNAPYIFLYADIGY